MDITDILLPLKPGRDERAACAVAARLGQEYGARVRGLCLTPLPRLQPEDCYVVGAEAAHMVMSRFDQDVAAGQAGLEKPFHEAMEQAATEHAWSVTSPGELAAETALRARTTDLVVLTRPWTRDGVDLPFAECVIRLSGTPCLLVPPSLDIPPSFDHVVVAWNGSRQVKRALDDALPFLKAATRVTLLMVGQAEGPHASSAELVEHLARKDVSANLAITAKGEHGAGRALLDWCAEHQADMLVMGAFGHTPRAERWLGGSTWSVLTKARLPVLMSC